MFNTSKLLRSIPTTINNQIIPTRVISTSNQLPSKLNKKRNKEEEQYIRNLSFREAEVHNNKSNIVKNNLDKIKPTKKKEDSFCIIS